MSCNYARCAHHWKRLILEHWVAILFMRAWSLCVARVASETAHYFWPPIAQFISLNHTANILATSGQVAWFHGGCYYRMKSWTTSGGIGVTCDAILSNYSIILLPWALGCVFLSSNWGRRVRKPPSLVTYPTCAFFTSPNSSLWHPQWKKCPFLHSNEAQSSVICHLFWLKERSDGVFSFFFPSHAPSHVVGSRAEPWWGMALAYCII